MDAMTAPDAAATPARRRPVWVIGAVLWAGVFAALAAVFLMRGDAAEPAGTNLAVAAQGEGGALLKPEGEPESAPAEPKPLPEFSLPERRGETVTRDDLKGKVSVVGFIFTRCASTCPRVSKAMAEQRKTLKDAGVQFVSLSVDPEYDTPEILTTYADTSGRRTTPAGSGSPATGRRFTTSSRTASSRPSARTRRPSIPASASITRTT